MAEIAIKYLEGVGHGMMAVVGELVVCENIGLPCLIVMKPLAPRLRLL